MWFYRVISYRPDDREKEQVLYDKQQAQLRPFLKWFSSFFNMELMLHFSVIPEAQPEETINGLRLLLHNTTGTPRVTLKLSQRTGYQHTLSQIGSWAAW